MASCRLHSQTVALCQCTEAMYYRFTPRVRTAEAGMQLVQTEVDLCFVEL